MLGVKWILSPWIQPFGRPVREEDSPRLVAFPFDLAVAFFARSRAAVFSFPIVASETRTERWREGESERSGGAWRGEEIMGTHCSGDPGPTPYMRPLSSG